MNPRALAMFGCILAPYLTALLLWWLLS